MSTCICSRSAGRRKARYEAVERIPTRLQGVLDALALCPALVKNSIWNILAWNRAAAAVLADYGAILPEQRNGLRLALHGSAA